MPWTGALFRYRRKPDSLIPDWIQESALERISPARVPERLAAGGLPSLSGQLRVLLSLVALRAIQLSEITPPSFTSAIHRRYARYAQIEPVASNTRQKISGGDVIYPNPPILERSVDGLRTHRWQKVYHESGSIHYSLFTIH